MEASGRYADIVLESGTKQELFFCPSEAGLFCLIGITDSLFIVVSPPLSDDPPSLEMSGRFSFTVGLD